MIDNIQEQSAKNAYCSELDEILEDLVRDSQEDVSDFKLNSLPHELIGKNGAKQAIIDWHNKQIEAELEALREEVKHEDLRTISQIITARINKLKESINGS